MADEKIITSSVFEQGVTEIMQDIANNLYEFEEYTEEEVANLIDLSEEEVAELTRVINDTTVALNKVYSNKKVEDLLTELEVTCNQYADEKIGGLAGIHLAYVDTLPATGEDNVIYILKSTTGGNDTLNLYNNGWISIGEFTISLDNYYDKTEVDTLLNDKANANEVISQNDVVSDMSNVSSSTVLSTTGLEVELDKKANLDDMTTELDKKIDKDNIVTVLDDTVTNEQVPSAKVVVDELNTKANDSEVLKKTDISTTINSTSTNDTVPTSKAIYDNAVKSLSKIKKTNTFTKADTGVNTLLEFICNNDFCKDTSAEYVFGVSGFDDLPTTDWGYTIRVYNTGGAINVFAYKYLSNDVVYVRGITADGKWNGVWKKVCTTTVADVNETKIEIDENALGLTIVNNNSLYKVINGVCYGTIELFVNAPNNDKSYGYTKINTTNIPKVGFKAKSVLNIVELNTTISVVIDKESTDIKLHGKIIGKEGNYTIQGSFSYPVAE